MKDFFLTLSLYSLDMIIPILLIFLMFYNVPFTARMNISFIEGMISWNERRLHFSFILAITLRIASS